tara:strand:- start:332 stop:784 length:453 start_codon:yes stop_codon:yes gene_type:complete
MKPPKRLGTILPYKKRTRTTTPSVYNTSSTITVLYHAVGDTKEECFAGGEHVHDTKREREREITREREREILPKKQERSCEKRDTPPKIIHLRKRLKKSKTNFLSNARESLVFSTRDERYSLSWSRLTDSRRVLTRSLISPLVFAQTTST